MKLREIFSVGVSPAAARSADSTRRRPPGPPQNVCAILESRRFELGYRAASVEAGLGRAVGWYRENKYLSEAEVSARRPEGRYVTVGESGSR